MTVCTKHPFQRRLCYLYMYITAQPMPGCNVVIRGHSMKEDGLALLCQHLLKYTLGKDSIFSASQQQSKHLETHFIFPLQPQCLFTLKFFKLTHNFGRCLRLIQGSCSELSFSYLLSIALQIPY